MIDKAVLNRVQADLREAQGEIETAPKVNGSLGDSLSFGFRSLLAAVGQLFAGFSDHERRIDEQEKQIKIALAQIAALNSKIHGLRISKGKAVAAKERALAKAQATLDHTKDFLERISIH